MKKSVIVSPSSSHYVVITTIIVYALIAPIFFEMDNAYGEVGSNFVVVVVDNDNKDQMVYNQQVVETTECKSPCSSSAEMCITMCA
ncbi:MAG: hypothetical protein QOK71_11250 [Nitrososphaeraceae archaeon]|nr:hypothetical protein [Nitrososphaeraceae archaeon]